jgi:hypothetical protein
MNFHSYSFTFFLLFITLGCSSKNDIVLIKQDDVLQSFSIELLSSQIYYFPAKKFKESPYVYQPLQKFDLIFVGHDIENSSTAEDGANISRVIPGYFTHVLSYIGKDSDGFAYAIEMNANEEKSFTIGLDGMRVDGGLYIYCLGSDYGAKKCPKDDYVFGLETYDYMWAKRLKPELKKQFLEHEDAIIATIKEDLLTQYPFEVPFHIGLETTIKKEIIIIDDGRKNGADCTSYFVSLFEEVAEVCLDDVRVNAKTLESYYTHNPVGVKAIIPAKYNLFSSGDIHFKDLIGDMGYSFVDNVPRQTLCPDKRKVIGLSTPNMLFNSPSLVEIKSK